MGATFRPIQTRFWTDPKLRETTPTERLLFLYFITSPHSHLSGIYYCPIALVHAESGIPSIPLRRGINTLSELGLILYDEGSQVVWVRSMLKNQARGAKILKATANQLDNLHNCPLIPMFLRAYDTLSIPYQMGIDYPSFKDKDKDKDKSKEKEKKGAEAPCEFSPESLEISECLRDRIREHTPEFEVATRVLKGTKWAKAIQGAVDHDNRTHDQLRNAIDFVHGSTAAVWWRSKVLTGAKLREHFNTLATEARNAGFQKKGKGVSSDEMGDMITEAERLENENQSSTKTD